MTIPAVLAQSRSREGFGFLVAYAACIPAANWFIQHVGTTCLPNGPCLIPVGPRGLSAPSGVLMIGLALVLRDLVQRRLGVRWAFGAIANGAALSAMFVPPSLIVASVAAFILSEAADLAVYTPLQRRGLILAVLASSVVGFVVDSMLFLYLAFGNLDYLIGQILGKFWAVIVTLPAIAWLKRRDEVVETKPLVQ
ncbi:beta-carotene 15,15'-monooxygenase (plasmid) [Methylobacterium sp. XJLW]|uniref:VUT family protein n=1 Tax=Methylobacterium sp. XJLW TaxID=739141 RepID=UPI000DAAF79F|nr:VUT family protein [Methylobacterium sp. XJLW]AWV19819.1 beta-carotene 15,15'-monooxygenase [Methylobacterium sp. XJLW]